MSVELWILFRFSILIIKLHFRKGQCSSMTIFKDKKFLRCQGLESSPQQTDLSLFCKVTIIYDNEWMTFDNESHIYYVELRSLILLCSGWSHVQPPVSVGEAQWVPQEGLPCLLSSEVSQTPAVSWSALQVTGETRVIFQSLFDYMTRGQKH